MSMELNKANECTCPSGDGSLVHPCPAHPAVEQVGANVGHGHVFPRADGVKMRCGGPGLCSECTADASRARAALAQADEKPGDSILCYGCFAKGVGPDHFDEAGKCLVAQAEAKRPEVVARVVHSNPVVLGQCGPLNANDELMTVAQHAASVARWAEMFNRVEQQRDAALVEVERLRESKGDPVGSLEKCMKVMYERDEHAKRLEAALARVAELEKQEPVATVAKVPGEDWNSLDFHRDLQHMQPGTKLYAAPVAMAQHSVPDVSGCRRNRSALTDAQMRRLYDNSTEAEKEHLGFAAFARMMRLAEAVHQIAAAPAQGGE